MPNHCTIIKTIIKKEFIIKHLSPKTYYINWTSNTDNYLSNL